MTTTPPAAPYTGAGAVLRAPEGTVTNTVWIWLILVLPLLPILGLLGIDWSGFMSRLAASDGGLDAQLALYTSPGYLLATVGGWVVYGLNAFFAFRDWRFLQRAGVPRPFHFAWVFLSSIVYAIGRAVVVKRRTGHGSAVLWAAIVSIVLSFVIAVAMVVAVFTAALSLPFS